MTKNKSKPIALLATGLLWMSLAQAQESINSSGSNATGSGGSVSYSIGQMVYTTDMGSSGSITQGVQHAYEIFTVGVNETVLDISVITFPNPTVDNLSLQINDYSNEKLLYQLFDMQGRLLKIGQISEQLTQINTAILPTSTYFIHVLNQQNQKVQSFKIIKK